MIYTSTDDCIKGIAEQYTIIKKFEKYYRHYIDLADLDGVYAKIVVGYDSTKDADEYKKLVETANVNAAGSLGITVTELMVSANQEIDDCSIIREVRCTTLIPMSTIMQIHCRCRHWWQRNFIIRFIVRHEVGHVMDSYNYLNIPLGAANRFIRERINELIKIKSDMPSDKMITLDQWLSINRLSALEESANRRAMITDRELKKFYNIYTMRRS